MKAADTAREISLDDAIPGMTLAEADIDKSGSCLISQGVSLTEKSIYELGQHGGIRIHVMMPSNGDGCGEDCQVLLRRLDFLFENSLASEPNRLLLDSLRRYRVRKKSNDSFNQ